jgi:hypothetical protein
MGSTSDSVFHGSKPPATNTATLIGDSMKIIVGAWVEPPAESRKYANVSAHRSLRVSTFPP